MKYLTFRIFATEIETYEIFCETISKTVDYNKFKETQNNCTRDSCPSVCVFVLAFLSLLKGWTHFLPSCLSVCLFLRHRVSIASLLS